MSEIQKRKFNFLKEVYQKFEVEPDYIFSSHEIQQTLGSIFTINELFSKLENYGISIPDKDQIITGKS